MLCPWAVKCCKLIQIQNVPWTRSKLHQIHISTFATPNRSNRRSLKSALAPILTSRTELDPDALLLPCAVKCCKLIQIQNVPWTRSKPHQIHINTFPTPTRRSLKSALEPILTSRTELDSDPLLLPCAVKCFKLIQIQNVPWTRSKPHQIHIITFPTPGLVLQQLPDPGSGPNLCCKPDLLSWCLGSWKTGIRFSRTKSETGFILVRQNSKTRSDLRTWTNER